MKTLTLILVCALAGCATMHKPGETVDSKAVDRYACEQDTYVVANGNPGMLSNGFYRDCMRAYGYK
jgi:hypothetical protein